MKILIVGSCGNLEAAKKVIEALELTKETFKNNVVMIENNEKLKEIIPYNKPILIKNIERFKLIEPIEPTFFKNKKIKGYQRPYKYHK